MSQFSDVKKLLFYYTYAIKTKAHNIAVSGMNVTMQQIFAKNDWRTGFSKVSFDGGHYTVKAEDYGVKGAKLTSTSHYKGAFDTVIVALQPSSFSKYAYYSVVEGNIQCANSDVIWGPFHTQDRMNISGSPTFHGMVTTKVGTNPANSGAKFLGGYQSNVDIPLPANFSDLQTAGAAGGRVIANGDLWVTLADNMIKYKSSANGAVTTVPISTFAPNGVVVLQNGSLHIQGTLQGQLTFCTLGPTGSATAGNIYIDDDIKYKSDPRTNPKSKDMLGLVCENKVIIEDNAVNNKNCIINASILCRSGGLEAENYKTLPICGTLEIFGGLIQYKRGAVGRIGSLLTINHGFQKNYVYDDRFVRTAPPYFPFTGKLQVLSWAE